MYIDQQDAQEFLSELLDSLHEDLNRYRKSTTPPLTTPIPPAVSPPPPPAPVVPQQEGQSQGQIDQPSLTKNGEQKMGQANGADGDNKLLLTQHSGVINVEVS